jgi:replicative DNA helicase
MSKEPSIQDFIKQLGAEIYQAEQTKEQLVQLARLKEIAKVYEGEDKLISSYQVAERLKTQPEEFKIPSGFSPLDAILKGFRLRQVVTIAAPTTSGKTSLCVDLTTKMRAQTLLWFPFEEGADELVQKFLDRNEEPPLFYVPARITGNTLLWIEKKIIEAIAKYGTQVVFIDHLHFIVPFSTERQDLRIGETMRALKTMAKKWNIVIFLIAHLKKTRLDTAPDLEDLRDSSFIAQESDTVIILWREATRGRGEVVITDNVTVSVQANRRTGKTGNVKMVFKDGHFYEQALE